MPKIVRFHTLGDADVLKIEDLPLDEPQLGEVRLKVEAIGLNRAEALFRQGKYVEQPNLPSRLGYEAAGIIDAYGEGVTNVKVGDRVSTIAAHSMRKYGVYGEFAIVPARSVSPYPANLSPEEGTSFWIQYLTGYFALVEIGKLQSGQNILITAASSSTGYAAIQLAKAIGAVAIATTRTSRKKQMLLQAGADYVIVTDEEDLALRVMEITSGKGANVIYDPIAGSTLDLLVNAAAKRGTIVLYGVMDNGPSMIPMIPAFLKCLQFRIYQLFEFTGNSEQGFPGDEEAFARGKQYIYDGLQTGKLKTLIDRTFKLDEIVEAHRYVESNQQIGKIVVTV